MVRLGWVHWPNAECHGKHWYCSPDSCRYRFVCDRRGRRGYQSCFVCRFLANDREDGRQAWAGKTSAATGDRKRNINAVADLSDAYTLPALDIFYCCDRDWTDIPIAGADGAVTLASSAQR